MLNLSRVGIVLLLVFLAGAARADIKKDDLVGKWKGKMTLSMGGGTDKNEDVDIAMDFTAAGKVTITTASSKAEETTYTVDKEEIVMKDPDGKGNDVRMTKVKLTATDLEADLVPKDVENMPKDAKIAVKLKKEK